MKEHIRSKRILGVLALLVLLGGSFALLSGCSPRESAEAGPVAVTPAAAQTPLPQPTAAEPTPPPPTRPPLPEKGAVEPTARPVYTPRPLTEEELRQEILSRYTLTAGRHETRYIDWGYLLYDPNLPGRTEKPPLVVYLPGTKGAGYDPTLLSRYDVGLGRFIDEGKIAVDALILLPQSESAWSSGRTEMAELYELIVWAIEAYDVDPDRVSLVGCSAGGIACFEMLAAHPESFCCGVVIGGATSPDAVADLKMPLRIYHGTKDTRMGFSVVDASALINANGGRSELILLKDVGHDEQFVLYDDEWGLWDWVLAQKRGA